MLKLEQAVLVEGKYDAARLTNLVDATILTTDGSRVFRDKELQNMLKRIAAAQGLIILTDSDDAGFRIRHFVTGMVGAEHVLQAKRSRRSLADVAKDFGYGGKWSYRLGETERTASRFKRRQLEKCLEVLQKLDTDLKSSKLDADLLMQKALCELALAGRS